LTQEFIEGVFLARIKAGRTADTTTTTNATPTTEIMDFLDMSIETTNYIMSLESISPK
jgi:hypothetical protein